MLRLRRPGVLVGTVAALAVSLCGCTSFRNYVHNGLKVGPNYCRPAAPVAEHWIDAADVNSQRGEDLSNWWTVFQDPVLKQPDPVLNCLIQTAYRQNLTLRQAGMRVLQARARLAIARGTFFPQSQDLTGSYTRNGSGLAGFSDSWCFGFNLSWELDFWGRFRRAIAAADDNLDASVEGYDFVLVTLLGDVAASYVQIRTDQEQIRLTQENVMLQRRIVDYLQKRATAGFGTDVQLNLDQAVGTLAQTEAGIPQLEIDLRQNNDVLCVLLGTPAVDLRQTIPMWKLADQRKAEETERVRKLLQQLLTKEGERTPEDLRKLETVVSPIYIPSAPAPKEVAIGIPADLLRRRPDVRQAERLAAAQAEEIGIAQADLYPTFTLDGTLGYQAQTFAGMFSSNALNGNFGPSFRWNLLNYGRIENNVRLQDARFRELVLAYQNTALVADQEVENGLVNFLRSDQRRVLFGKGVMALIDAVRYVTLQEAKGQIDINRYAVIAQNLVQQETSWARAYGDIAQGLITVYRALGGGWEIRLGGGASESPMPESPMPESPMPETPMPETPMPDTLPSTPKDAEEVPPPVPNVLEKIEEPLPEPRPLPGAIQPDTPVKPNAKP